MENMKIIYSAYSKRNFYFRAHISQHILKNFCVPLNPFMLFDYFMGDMVERDVVRNANNNIVAKCDEVWVFGQIADGVLAEIKLAKSLNKKIRYFAIRNSKIIEEISQEEVVFEEGLELEGRNLVQNE